MTKFDQGEYECLNIVFRVAQMLIRIAGFQEAFSKLEQYPAQRAPGMKHYPGVVRRTSIRRAHKKRRGQHSAAPGGHGRRAGADEP